MGRLLEIAELRERERRSRQTSSEPDVNARPVLPAHGPLPDVTASSGPPPIYLDAPCDAAASPAASSALASVAKWIDSACAIKKNVRANPRILYREWVRAIGASGETTCEVFLAVLGELGFEFDPDGLVVGVCLAVDWKAANGEKPF